MNKLIKCVIWDLDNTLWKGILSEGDAIEPSSEILDFIKRTDLHGVLHSIASRNNHDEATAQLEKIGMLDYFLFPQVNWGSKSTSIKVIREKINISLDSMAFIDDQQFERAEVNFELPEIQCYPPSFIDDPWVAGWLNSITITPESRTRRLLYQQEEKRKVEEQRFDTNEGFLASLNLEFRISRATEIDLLRVEELTTRTHQLNTTGTVYSKEELLSIIRSPDYLLLVCELTDRFGSYGKIGLALIETKTGQWTIKLLIMSCRVISRGVGAVLLSSIVNSSIRANAMLLADFIHTNVNRGMYINFKFADFHETTQLDGNAVLFEYRLRKPKTYPAYLTVIEDY